MAKINVETYVKNLKSLDKEVLVNIYKYRCVNKNILLRYFYEPAGKNKEYVEYKIRTFDKHGLLQFSTYENGKRAIFLTAQAVNALKTMVSLPEELFDFYNKRTAVGLYSAAELKIKEKLLLHQLTLVDFSLALQKEVLEKVPTAFYNDKYSVIKYVDLHPDGIICAPDVDLLLENDMGTERRKDLDLKWTLYSQYIHSGDFTKKDAEVCVLFVLQNKNPQVRKKLVLDTLGGALWSEIGKSIEIFIGDPFDIKAATYSYIKPKYINKKIDILNLSDPLREEGFLTYKGERFKESTSGETFDLYVKNDSEEYFMDYYIGSPVSVLKKVSILNNIKGKYKADTGREFKYIILTEDIPRLKEDLRNIGEKDIQNVFIAKPSKVIRKSLKEAMIPL